MGQAARGRIEYPFILPPSPPPRNPALAQPRIRPTNKKIKKISFQLLDFATKRIRGTRDAPALAPPALRRKKIKKKTKSHIISLTVPQKKTKRKRCACSSAGGASKGIVEKASGSRTPLFFQGGGCRMIEYVE